MTEEDQSVLAIPLPEAENVLSFVRSTYKGEMSPAGVPAHITLLYPWMEPKRISKKTLAELTSLFAGFPKFSLSLKLGWFGREVLLLIPHDPLPLIRLTKEIIHQWPEYPYYGGDYDDIEPHITLAYGDESNLIDLAKDVASQLPLRADISSVDLSIGRPGQMITHAKFSLSLDNSYLEVAT
jgi:hypothetical protein